MVYKPPNGNVYEFLYAITSKLLKLEKEKKIVYLMGDFNINLFNADTHNPTSECSTSMYSKNLFRLIS